MYGTKGGALTILVLLAVAAFGLANVCHAQDEVNVKLWQIEGLHGQYLADGKSMMLYFFLSDSPGKSSCTGDCLANWPIFYIEKPVLGPRLAATGIKPEDFTTITREDGKVQTAFKGWPLYYFAKDTQPGVGSGDKVKDVWVLADPVNPPRK